MLQKLFLPVCLLFRCLVWAYAPAPTPKHLCYVWPGFLGSPKQTLRLSDDDDIFRAYLLLNASIAAPSFVCCVSVLQRFFNVPTWYVFVIYSVTTPRIAILVIASPNSRPMNMLFGCLVWAYAPASIPKQFCYVWPGFLCFSCSP